MIKIKLNHNLQPYAGNQDIIEVSGNTVRECLDNLGELYPVFKEILFDTEGFLSALVFLNGETILPNDLDRPITLEDDFLLAPMIHGG